jgi:hypothetical protein
MGDEDDNDDDDSNSSDNNSNASSSSSSSSSSNNNNSSNSEVSNDVNNDVRLLVQTPKRSETYYHSTMLPSVGEVFAQLGLKVMEPGGWWASKLRERLEK